MNKQSFLNAKLFAALLIASLATVTEIQGQHKDDGWLAGGGVYGTSTYAGMMAGAAVGGPFGAAVGASCGFIAAIPGYFLVDDLADKVKEARRSKKAAGIKIEFERPEDECDTTLSYDDDAYDIQAFRRGEQPLVIWRIHYPVKSEISQLEQRINHQLLALRQELGKPILNGQLVKIDDEKLRTLLAQKIANPPHQEIMNLRDRIFAQFENLSNPLQKLALLSWGTPNDRKNFDFQLALATIIAHATATNVNAYTLAVQDQVEKYHQWWQQDYTANQNAQKELATKATKITSLSNEVTYKQLEMEKVLVDLLQMNQQKQRVEADLAQERAQHQKALQELEAAKQKEQEVINMLGEVEELEEKNAELATEVSQRRAASPARRAELQQKDAEIAELKAMLEARQKQHERSAMKELPIIHVLAPAPAEKPFFQSIQNWLEEKLK